jgi:cytochrome c5
LPSLFFEDAMSDNAHESHTGPIKTPSQLLWTSFFSFVVPIFVIIGLVYAVTSGDKPSAGADNSELATAIRIQRVGAVVLQAGERKLKDGAEAYASQCAACHATGMLGSPKFGDAAAWGPRITQGYQALINSAMKGKGAMSPQAGGNLSDLEIARAVAHMANAGGAKFEPPAAPAPAEAAK